jgi:hypothetical protein
MDAANRVPLWLILALDAKNRNHLSVSDFFGYVWFAA